MHKRLIITIVGVFVLLAATTAILKSLIQPRGTALVFVKYVQNPWDHAWFAEVLLTNLSQDCLIMSPSVVEGNLYPNYSYREQPRHFWQLASTKKAPTPTMKPDWRWGSPSEWHVAAGEQPALRIPLVPGAPPKRVGIEFQSKGLYVGKSKLMKNLAAAYDRLEQKWKMNSGWRVHEAWSWEYVAAPNSPDAVTSSPPPISK